MTASGRRMLVVALVVVLGGLGWLAASLLESDDAGLDDRDAGPAVVQRETEVPEPIDVAPAAAPTPAPVAEPEPAATGVVDFGDVLAASGDVFVRGWVRAPVETDMTAFEVSLYDLNGDDVEWAEPNEQGYFEIRHDGTLLAGWGVGTSAGFADHRGAERMILPAWSGSQPTHASAEPPVEVELVTTFAPRLHGLVIDRATNMPVEDAEVAVGSSLPAWLIEEDFTETDENGYYAIELPEIPPHDVLVWCRTWDHQALVMGPLDLLGTDDYELNIFLEESNPIVGRVVDAAGAPVVDATVTLGSDHLVFEDDHDWEFTDEEGRFELDPVDVPLDGAWLHVESYEHAPTLHRLAPPYGPVEIRLEPAIDFTGVVVDQAGEPVEGADVLVVFYRGWLGLENGIYDENWTDADGTFEFRLETAPPAESQVIVEAEDYRSFAAPLTTVATYDATSGAWVAEIVLRN